jgi:hypothetical protein
MKRKMTNSKAIALIVLLSLMTFVPTAHGQQPKRKPVADTAVLTPAEGQTVRITVAPGFGVDDVSVILAWKQYMPDGCSGTPPVCRHITASGGSAPYTLGANDAISFDVPGNGNGLRLMVFANRDVQVLAQIIDSQDNVVVAFRPTAGDSTVAQ